MHSIVRMPKLNLSRYDECNGRGSIVEILIFVSIQSKEVG